MEEESDETLMSDSPEGDGWFTAIGAIKNYPANSETTFPGQYAGQRVYKVELYAFKDGSSSDNKDGERCTCTSGYRKVFSHNSNEKFFANNAEALWKNADDESEPLFSRLKDIKQYKDVEGKFRFKLVYPEVPGFIEWTQTSNPITEEDITDFKLIDNKAVRQYLSSTKGGLGPGTKGQSLMDDTPKDSDDAFGLWRTAIGAQKSWPDSESRTFPGPAIREVDGGSTEDVKDVPVHAVELYVFYGN